MLIIKIKTVCDFKNLKQPHHNHKKKKMKNLLLSILVLIISLTIVHAQTYNTKDGNVYFNPNKNQNNRQYEALSKEAAAMFNSNTSEVALFVAMRTFHFNNALLEVHFNENYLNTAKFPSATFKGKLIGFDKSMLKKDGEYKLKSEGIIVLHGVTKSFKTPITMIVKNNTVTFKCGFLIKAVDYKIKIPAVAKPKLLEATPLISTITFKM